MKVIFYMSDDGLSQFNRTGQIRGSACQTDTYYLQMELDLATYEVVSHRGTVIASKRK